jgi:molybdopterin synthase sulfur carrier subunit
MSITVKFFASLRETVGRPDCSLSADAISTANDVWAAATDGQQRPPNTLIAINMEYANAESPVKEGDEVAFFPPVTGG